MKLRAASLIVGFAFAALSVQAQNPGPPPGSGATIQSLAADLAALAARVAKLEGNITAADLVGTYALVGIDIPLNGHLAAPLRNATIQTDAFGGTLMLNANGTLSLVLTGCSSKLTEGTRAWTSLGCGNEAVNGTWSYTNGVVTVDAGEFDAQFSVGVGGRLLTTAFNSLHTADQSSDTVIVILSRLQ